MDERAAIEEAVRSRLSFLKAINDPELGVGIFLDQQGVFNQPWALRPKHIIRAEVARRYHAEVFSSAPMFFLPKLECETLDVAWESFPTVRMELKHLIKPSGFVYFEKPITDPQDQDPLDALYALAWSMDSAEDSPYPLETFQEDPKSLTILGFIDTADLRASGVVSDDFPRIYPNVAVAWELNSDTGGYLTWWDETGLPPQDYRKPYIKLLHAFFNIIRTQLAEVAPPKERTKKTADRLKHAKRKFPNLNTGIQVVKFRQAKSSKKKATSKKERELTVRYWTGPFFVNQYFPSRDEHEVMLRMPQLRGPEDAPIVGRERIFKPPRPMSERQK